MSKKEFLDFVIRYRAYKSSQILERTVDVLGLGPVAVGFNPASRRHFFHLVNQNRPVVLGDLK